MNNADDRRNGLRRAEEAVDQGIPVPVNSQGHAMLIVGHDGDKIQIYDPLRGATVWVTEQDFINGNMHGVGAGSAPVRMRVPK